MVTKEEILSLASKRMMHYGIQKTSMQEIARDAGVAVGTLYLYFKNKEEIVLAIADECRAQQAAAAENIVKSALSPEEKFKEYLLERFRFCQRFREETPHGKELVRTLVGLKGDCQEQWRSRFETIVTQILEEGTRNGVFSIADPKREASAVFLCLQSFYPLPYLELPEWPREEDLMFVADWLLESWRGRKTGGRS